MCLGGKTPFDIHWSIFPACSCLHSLNVTFIKAKSSWSHRTSVSFHSKTFHASRTFSLIPVLSIDVSFRSTTKGWSTQTPQCYSSCEWQGYSPTKIILTPLICRIQNTNIFLNKNNYNEVVRCFIHYKYKNTIIYLGNKYFNKANLIFLL